MEVSTDEYEALAEFLYLCPVALAEIDDQGAIRMMNAKGAQIFMQIARNAKITNLFDVLRNHLPRLELIAKEHGGEPGVISENLRVDAGRPSKRSKVDLVFLVSLVRVGPNRMMATAQDISWSAAQEKQAREAEERLRLVMEGARDV